jgi:hypothetical protein
MEVYGVPVWHAIILLAHPLCEMSGKITGEQQFYLRFFRIKRTSQHRPDLIA